MNKIISLLALTVGTALLASEPATKKLCTTDSAVAVNVNSAPKQKLLDAVTIIKPLQELIKSYLFGWEEVPASLLSNTVVRTIACSNYNGLPQQCILSTEAASNLEQILEDAQFDSKLFTMSYMHQIGSYQVSHDDTRFSRSFNNTCTDVRNPVFVADYKIMAVLLNGSVELFDCSHVTGIQKIIQIPEPKKNIIDTFALSQDGNLIAYPVMIYNKSAHGFTYAIKIYDITSKKIMQEFSVPQRVEAIAISPNANYIAWSADEICLHDIKTGKLIKKTASDATKNAHRLAFSPDGIYLAFGRLFDTSIRLWNIKTGNIHEIICETSQSSLSVSANGAYITACQDTNVPTCKLWKNQACEIELADHEEENGEKTKTDCSENTN